MNQKEITKLQVEATSYILDSQKTENNGSVLGTYECSINIENNDDITVESELTTTENELPVTAEPSTVLQICENISDEKLIDSPADNIFKNTCQTAQIKADDCLYKKFLAPESGIMGELICTPFFLTCDLNAEDLQSVKIIEAGFGDNANSKIQDILAETKQAARQMPQQPQYGYGAPGGGYVPAQQQAYGQTPYYQQQVAGQPVYSTGPPPPIDVTRGPTVQPGRQAGENYQWDTVQNEGYTQVFTNTFDSHEIRRRFVQRVYTMLSVMLAFTFGVIALCIWEPHIKQYLLDDIVFLIFGGVMFLISGMALMCYQRVRRTVPLNFILLCTFTLGMSMIAGAMSAQYKTHLVLIAFGITAFVTVAISIFACRTSWDTTGYGLYLYVALIVLVVVSFVAILVAMFTGIKLFLVIVDGLFVLLFCMYLVYDTQQIMGGRRYELSPEEYIAGAIMLYIDIMYMFIYLLQILGFLQQ